MEEEVSWTRCCAWELFRWPKAMEPGLLAQLAAERRARLEAKQAAAGAPAAGSEQAMPAADNKRAGGIEQATPAANSEQADASEQQATPAADSGDRSSVTTGSGRRLRDGADVVIEPTAQRQRIAVGSALEGIFLSGVEDAPPEAKHATEIDCRKWEAGFEAEGASSRVFKFKCGEGKLNDRKGGDFERNVRHLTNSALKVVDARRRGETVWVHCSMGMNRGPAGVIAYLLLHTDVPTLREVHRLVKELDAHRRKARTRSNTFAAELEHICVVVAGKPLE